jgi:hypothetical protein
MESGNTAEAKESRLQTILLDPTDAWTFLILGNLLSKAERDYAGAEALYRRAIELRPDDPYILTSYAASLANRGQHEKAREHLQRALELNPDYPNAHCAIALSYAHEDEWQAALDSLDALFDRPASRDIRSGPLYTEARRIYLMVARSLAENSYAFLMELVERRKRAIEADIGVAINLVEDERLENVPATTQFAWNYGREAHLVKYRNKSSAQTPHLVAHELQHIALAHAAIVHGSHRSFATTEQTREQGMRAIDDHRYKLQTMGYADDSIDSVMNQFYTGLMSQLFNCPIDMVIEWQLHRDFPELSPSQFVSLYDIAYADTIGHLDSAEIKKATPYRVYQANLAMNCATALFVDRLYEGRTTYSGPYAQSKFFAKGNILFGLWLDTMESYAPGDEYDLVDAFADVLDLKEWYQWQYAEPVMPSSRQGVSNEELLKAKESASVMYCLDALQRFDDMGHEQVFQIVTEIALLGRSGIDYASSEQTYRLQTIPDKEFSGLHLLALMYVGFKIVDPTVDTGIDLGDAYAVAQQLHQGGA